MDGFKRIYPILFLLFTPLINSCHKDKASTPVIELLAPATPGNYHFGDTIHIIARVNDDENISSLSCSLINGMNTPVLPVHYFSTGKKEINIDFYYVINNMEIPTDNYNIMIFASDGESDSRKYGAVFVNELPRHLEQVYITGAGNNNNTNVYKTDTAQSLSLLMSIPGDFSAAAISSRYRQFYTSGNYTGNINAISTESNTIVWSILNQSSGGAPYFTGITSDPDGIYVSYHEGKVNGYNYLKNQQFFAATDINSFPVMTLSFSRHLLVIEEFITGGKNLVSYSNPEGNSMFVVPVTFDVSFMIGKNNEEVYLAGNENGFGKIFLFNLSNGQLTLRQQYNSVMIYDGTPINEYYLVLATSSGLMEYDDNSNNLVPLINNFNGRLVKYDDAGNELFAAEGKKLNVYGYQLHNLVILDNFQVPDSVLSIDLLYNREKFE